MRVPFQRSMWSPLLPAPRTASPSTLFTRAYHRSVIHDVSGIEIRLGVWGRILAGEDAGRFVRIEDDMASSGGYLVSVQADLDHVGGHDSWVEKYEDLPRYFAEARWNVEWLE